jgi:hypothetical protein
VEACCEGGQGSPRAVAPFDDDDDDDDVNCCNTIAEYFPLVAAQGLQDHYMHSISLKFIMNS